MLLYRLCDARLRVFGNYCRHWTISWGEERERMGELRGVLYEVDEMFLISFLFSIGGTVLAYFSCGICLVHEGFYNRWQ